MGIINDVVVYGCDICNERFLNDLDVFVIDGQVDFSKKSFGILGEKEIVCPKCFLNKMFRETDKMEILNDVLDEYEEDEVEEDEVEEDGSISNNEYDWGEMMEDNDGYIDESVTSLDQDWSDGEFETEEEE